jgi:hypothetical protein
LLYRHHGRARGRVKAGDSSPSDAGEAGRDESAHSKPRLAAQELIQISSICGKIGAQTVSCGMMFSCAFNMILLRIHGYCRRRGQEMDGSAILEEAKAHLGEKYILVPGHL